MTTWAGFGRECMHALMQRGRANPTVTILGMTFKENVPDIRNSKVIDIVRELERVGVDVQLTDPLASSDETAHEYGINLTPIASLRPADAVSLPSLTRTTLPAGGRSSQNCSRTAKASCSMSRQNSIADKKPKGIDLWRP